MKQVFMKINLKFKIKTCEWGSPLLNPGFNNEFLNEIFKIVTQFKILDQNIQRN